MQQIMQDLKNRSFKQVYLLYGEEDYLRRQYRDKLKEAFVSPDDTMNYHYFEGKDINVGAVIDLLETLPFLAEKRVVFIENSELCKFGGEKLAEYLSNPAPSAQLVLIETKIDKRSRLFKIIRETGRVCEFTTPDENTLKKWIRGIAQKEDRVMTDRAMQIFLEKTGSDMENIRNELEKLLCYTLYKKEITPQDVENVCTQRISNRIFEMVAAIAEKKQKKALDMYYDLLTLKEAPLGILALIARQFNLMLQIKELQKKGHSSRAIGEKTGLSPYVVQKYEQQAKRFKTEELKKALKACVQADEAVKNGKMNDVLSVELLIIEYSR